MIGLNRNINLVLFAIFLLILSMFSVFAFEPLPGEPETCGDGIIDSNESLYNCNKDISPTIIDYYKCINVNPEKCIYHKIYTTTTTMIFSIFGVGCVGLYLITPR